MKYTNMLPVLALLLSLASASQSANRDSGPLLVFSRTLSGPLVHGLNVTVHYGVRNVGAKSALRVQLRDIAFPASRFSLLHGSFRHTWPSISSGDSAGLDVIITPKRAGLLFVAPPAITYRDPEADVARVTKLAVPESIAVEDLVVFRRRTDTHGMEWAMYAAAFVALVALPAAFYVLRAPKPDDAMTSKKH